MKTGATKDKATKALVPKLRFPEFRGAEGWNERPLADLMSESRLPGSKGNVAKKITVKLWGNGVFEKNNSIQGSINTQYFRRKAGQFIYSKLDFLNQAFGIIPPSLDNFESTVDLPSFDFADELNPVFLLEYVKRREFYERLGETADGTRKARRIHAETFLSFPIALPSPAEQQKIADCLGSLDELIAAQGRKVEALKAHKKGLMQQLFPREGETQPRLRFPEFKNSEEWRELPLAALAEKIMVGIASAATHAYRETGVPMLRNQNIKEGGIDDSSLLFIDPAYEVAHKNKRLRAGDVITVRTGYPGLSAVVTQRHHNAQCFTSLITRPKKDVLSPDYLCAYINSDIGKRFIIGAEAGGAQKNVNAGALEALPVHLPALDEQKRIASFMSSLDVLIAAAVQELDAIKTHKQGLMQQLFPSPDKQA